jgi:4a-hydroxytetrahydrobiopterin dehydratase
MTEPILTRTAASEAVADIGWRYLLATLAASVRVDRLQMAARVAAAATQACGADADKHLRIDLRADRVELVLQDMQLGGPTAVDTRLAAEITDAVRGLGLRIAPPTSEPGDDHPVQALEIAIDTLDREAIRPFWKAVLGYRDEPGSASDNGIIDPARQLPTVWFQQMDEPRPQRNRIHFDITVPHDEADRRVQAALAAGGQLLSDASSRAFRILADPEGNEICVCTWLDRD